ncbi:Protein of uncharacterised function (DUF2570) [Serratia marcescens]|uniref:DUF2570 family protein n=1 Tax=Serratia marcescens TaxID=615 RepID=UPI0007453C7B|nr:DUF2570 family protein [Serratia marcescens]MDX6800929.1 DUF2570 family protein [Serratia marcescens]CUY68245.1 Protein of uncharacterised function (DUF2570) [Serratia marcescens]CUY79833.1 Protein of uncharacterised function (DUF2570) [Serratia marcescens]CVA17252.1 Protein of uncharacterised function (DUF2570) [Serratia marcescens]CVC52688.1 Protein of uncharacterised function (DUF2570) [Serratia marcescens]
MKPLLILGAASIVLVSALCAVVNYYHDKSERLVSEVKQQEKTLAQQSGLITTLRADDARNRAMMAEQQRREQQLRQQGETYQRKYQDAIKNDECARRTAPGAVLDLLRGTDTTTAAGAARAVSP